MSVRDASGTVTAEFAVAVPAVLLVVGLIIGTLGAQRDAVTATAVASQVVRELARGESEQVVRNLVTQTIPGVQVTVSHPDSDHVCVRVEKPPHLTWVPDSLATATACARQEPA